MKFQPGNKLARKEKWNLVEIRIFQERLRKLRKTLNYSDEDLANALDYSTKYVRMLQGEWSYERQPSQEFIRRLIAFEQCQPVAKPNFAAVLAHDPKASYVPLSQVLGPYKQCPQCLWELKHGLRELTFTYWGMKSHRQKYCSDAHAKAARARRRKKYSRKVR